MLSAEALARRLIAVTYQDLPESTRHTARRCVYDAVACAAAGRLHSPVEMAHSYAVSWFGGGPASVWFRGTKMSPHGAAYVNAQAASILDMDDGHRAASGHPGAAVVPAALAVAEAVGANLQQVLVAITCGYEAGVGVAKARDPLSLLSVATGRWSAIAVAATVAKLRGFDAERFAHALAIAEAHAPNLLAADHAGFADSDTKEGIPWSVLAGMTAADQAALGLRGYLDGLDNPQVYTRGRAADYNNEQAWLIDSTYFKPYSCCRWTHSAIEAVSELRRAGVDPKLIGEIEVSTFQRALSLSNATAPRDLISAQFSVPFVLAVALVDGEEALQPLSDRALSRGDIIGAAERVQLRLDVELDSCFPVQIPARVSVRVGEQKYEKEVRTPLGDPANPLSDAQLVRKAVRLCDGFRAERQVSALAEELLFSRPPNQGGDMDSLRPLLDFVL